MSSNENSVIKTYLFKETPLVSLLAHRISGACCIFPESPNCSWARGSISLAAAVPLPQALSLSDPHTPGQAEPGCSGARQGFTHCCFIWVSFSHSVKPDLLMCFLSCILAPSSQHVGNYSVFFTSKQMPMEKYLAVGLNKNVALQIEVCLNLPSLWHY